MPGLDCQGVFEGADRTGGSVSSGERWGEDRLEGAAASGLRGLRKDAVQRWVQQHTSVGDRLIVPAGEPRLT